MSELIKILSDIISDASYWPIHINTHGSFWLAKYSHLINPYKYAILLFTLNHNAPPWLLLFTPCDSMKGLHQPKSVNCFEDIGIFGVHVGRFQSLYSCFQSGYFICASYGVGSYLQFDWSYIIKLSKNWFQEWARSDYTTSRKQLTKPERWSYHLWKKLTQFQ